MFPKMRRLPVWNCPSCREQVEDILDVCWNCQTPRDGSPAETYFSTTVSKEVEHLRERMAGQPTDSLLRIVNVDFKDYREEATELARAELQKRGLPQPPRLAKPIEKPTTKKPVNETSSSKDVRKHCVNCFAILDHDAKFCPDCRTPVPVDGMISCPSCKKSITATSQFCKYCSAVLTPERVSAPTSKQRAPRSIPLEPKGLPVANNLVFFGVLIGIVSLIAYLWGANYAGNINNMLSSGFSKMTGRGDPTYDFAIFAVNFGPFGFLAGLIMFIAGLILKYKRE
jgi:RNA polymerase subunit RPABC4/transcription elongation factor Spt4